MKRFEDMEAWKRARALTKQVFELVCEGQFSGNRRCIADQLIRASLSVTCNLAEGFERGSNADMRRMFQIAKGSCAEVRSILLIAGDLALVKPRDVQTLVDECWRIRGLIILLMKGVQESGVK